MLELCEICYDFMKSIGYKDKINIIVVEKKTVQGDLS